MASRRYPRSSRAQPKSRTATVEELNANLRESSRKGDADLLIKLLSEGADPFEGDGEGKTALHYAAECEDEDVACSIIKTLLRNDTNREKASEGDMYGRSVLHLAAFLGREVLCHWLLELDIDLIDVKDRDGQSAIFYAVAGAHDDPHVLQLFISREQGRSHVFVKDFSQTTPLHVAAASGNCTMVKMLLSLEIPGEELRKYIRESDVLGQTALHKAASGGHTGIVQVLLANGAHSLKERDCDGRTALDFAAGAIGKDAVKIAELLLHYCRSEKKRCLLLFASTGGIRLRSNPSLDKYLKQERERIMEILGVGFLLRVAASLGDIELTREFISRGADIALIRNEYWRATLTNREKYNVKCVLESIDHDYHYAQLESDKPALRDTLGRSPLAIGLAALFLNRSVKSPINVGIIGEWGIGKSSVMLQTESILLKKAAQLAFTSPFQENNMFGACESKLSVTGRARCREVANAIERLDDDESDGPLITDYLFYPIKRLKNFIVKWLGPEEAEYFEHFERFGHFERVTRFSINDQLKYSQLFKSLAVIDRRDMGLVTPDRPRTFEVDLQSDYLMALELEKSLNKRTSERVRRTPSSPPSPSTRR